MSKVTIIVPIYNAEEHIATLVESVLKQTFDDFELLLVDDGSTDTSFEVCQKYGQIDSRIRVLHKDNGGANSARRLGVSEAKGEYVLFVDADDEITANAISSLLNIATMLPDVDVVVGHSKIKNCGIIEQHRFISELLCGICDASMPIKLYRAHLLKKHFIDIPSDLVMGEDLLQNLNLALFARKVVYSDLIYYIYKTNSESVCHRFVRTQEYENRFHAYLSTLLIGNDVWVHLTEVQQGEILFNWRRSRLNGCLSVILHSSSFDFKDESFMSLKKMMRKHMCHLRADEILLMTVPSLWLCRFLLKAYYKVRSIVARDN